MRIVLQRVSSGSVTVFDDNSPDGRRTGEISHGIVLLVGFHRDDQIDAMARLAKKVLDLRIFEDENGKMNRSILDISGQLLVISQFTLYGDTRKGRRPGFSDAMPPDRAEPMYIQFVELLIDSGLDVQTGEFGAKMAVEINNDGPVTFILDHDVS